MDAVVRKEAEEVDRLRRILGHQEERKSQEQQLQEEAREMAQAQAQVSQMGTDLYAQKSAI